MSSDLQICIIFRKGHYYISFHINNYNIFYDLCYRLDTRLILHALHTAGWSGLLFRIRKRATFSSDCFILTDLSARQKMVRRHLFFLDFNRTRWEGVDMEEDLVSHSLIQTIDK